VDLNIDESHPDIPRLKLRSGAILVTQEPEQFIGEKKSDLFTVYIALNEAGSAQGSLYLDDGESFQFENDQYALLNWTAQLQGGEFIFNEDKEGKYDRSRISLQLVIFAKSTFKYLLCTGYQPKTAFQVESS